MEPLAREGQTADYWLRLIEWRMWHFARHYAKFWALARAVHRFQRYLWWNGGLVPNYARRRRAGQVISTAFVESLVNSLLSKRFAKKQSMQWTPEGAHLLLQTRTRTLNGDLVQNFRRWYPAFSVDNQSPRQAARRLIAPNLSCPHGQAVQMDFQGKPLHT
jgi:hypothetical protein